jgi:hypothetical protein
MAGVAVDHTFPLQSVLVTAETFAQQPLDGGGATEWNAGIGTRYQLAPRWALDAGAGRTLTGDDARWYVTMGGAFVIGMPGGARRARSVGRSAAR